MIGKEWLGLIIPGVVTVVAGLVVSRLRARPRVVYWIPLVFTFDLTDEKVVLHTHSLTVQNVGKESAEDVEVIHSAKPDFMKILPPLDFTEDTTPAGEHVIRIKNLGPNEHFFTQMLSYKTPVPALLNVRSKAGQAKPVPVQFQRVYPKWMYWLVGFLLVVGIFVVSYWIYRGAAHLAKIVGIA